MLCAKTRPSRTVMLFWSRSLATPRIMKLAEEIVFLMHTNSMFNSVSLEKAFCETRDIRFLDSCKTDRLGAPEKSPSVNWVIRLLTKYLQQKAKRRISNRNWQSNKFVRDGMLITGTDCSRLYDKKRNWSSGFAANALASTNVIWLMEMWTFSKAGNIANAWAGTIVSRLLLMFLKSGAWTLKERKQELHGYWLAWWGEL